MLISNHRFFDEVELSDDDLKPNHYASSFSLNLISRSEANIGQALKAFTRLPKIEEHQKNGFKFSQSIASTKPSNKKQVWKLVLRKNHG